MALSEKHIALLESDHIDRMEYTVQKAIEFEHVWTYIENEELVLMNNGEHNVLFIWPHKALAEHCMFEDYKASGVEVVKIKLEDLMMQIIPEFLKNDIQFGIFINHNFEGVMLNAIDLRARLIEEERVSSK